MAVLRKNVAGRPTLNTALAMALLDSADPKAGAELAKGLPEADQKVLGDLLAALQGMTGPAAYCHVTDIKKSLQSLLDAGAVAQQALKDVGGGKLTASVKDADGNIIWLLEEKR